MSITPLALDHGSLPSAAAELAAAHADVARLAAAMTDELTGLATRWQGAGAAAFTQLMTLWEERRRHLTLALTEFADALTATERELLAVDDSQAGMFASAQVAA